MKKFPEINKINNLVELFFNQYENQFDKSKILLSSLKEPRKNYSWQETFNSINKLSEELKKFVNVGDRCLLISENRPEWFISDLSIMLSGSITVPAYTTYAERDYEYIINDCKPTVVFVSNLERGVQSRIRDLNPDIFTNIIDFELTKFRYPRDC
mgnify:CR=1 FL=1